MVRSIRPSSCRRIAGVRSTVRKPICGRLVKAAIFLPACAASLRGRSAFLTGIFAQDDCVMMLFRCFAYSHSTGWCFLAMRTTPRAGQASATALRTNDRERPIRIAPIGLSEATAYDDSLEMHFSKVSFGRPCGRPLFYLNASVRTRAAAPARSPHPHAAHAPVRTSTPLRQNRVATTPATV